MSTTLRHQVFEFKLGFLTLRVGPGRGWFERRFWRLFDETVWIGLEGAVEGFLAGWVPRAGLTLVDLVRRHQADASMVMVVDYNGTNYERLRGLTSKNA